jgi:hypothetical protein
MNKQTITYILMGLAVGMVIVGMVFMHMSKEDDIATPQIKVNNTITVETPPREMNYPVPSDSLPPHSELKRIGEAQQQEKQELAELLEERRQIAASVREEVEASMNKPEPPENDGQQVRSAPAQVARPAPVSKPPRRTSTALPDSIRFGEYYLHH